MFMIVDLNEDFMKSYLSSHREVLEAYIMEYITSDQLECWVKKKKENTNAATPIRGTTLHCLSAIYVNLCGTAN